MNLLNERFRFAKGEGSTTGEVKRNRLFTTPPGFRSEILSEGG